MNVERTGAVGARDTDQHKTVKAEAFAEMKQMCINCMHLRADWDCDQSGRRVEDPFTDQSNCPWWREGGYDPSFKNFPECTPEFEDLMRDTIETALRENQEKKKDGLDAS